MLLPLTLSNSILEHQIDIDTQDITEELISSTVHLYVEAISFYQSLGSSNKGKEVDSFIECDKRRQFYQDKIKKLLVRADVQLFLVGNSQSQCAARFQKQLQMIEKYVPEQARSLAKRYNLHKNMQDKMIKCTLNEQALNLKTRMQRRSRSKHRQLPIIDNIPMKIPAIGRISQIPITF